MYVSEQVQDAGLIFLSTMATAVVASMGGEESDGASAEKVCSNTLPNFCCKPLFKVTL